MVALELLITTPPVGLQFTPFMLVLNIASNCAVTHIKHCTKHIATNTNLFPIFKAYLLNSSKASTRIRFISSPAFYCCDVQYIKTNAFCSTLHNSLNFSLKGFADASVTSAHRRVFLRVCIPAAALSCFAVVDIASVHVVVDVWGQISRRPLHFHQNP